MQSQTTKNFWKLYQRLPLTVQRQAVRTYMIWKNNPMHPSLQFKHISNDVYSVRIGLNWRALALVENNTATWFWIGSHADYDNEI